MASTLKTQVVTNLYEFLSSAKPKKRYIEKLKSLFSKLWKSMPYNCLVTNIIENILFCFQVNKEMYTGV